VTVQSNLKQISSQRIHLNVQSKRRFKHPLRATQGAIDQITSPMAMLHQIGLIGQTTRVITVLGKKV
jgi:hypothetical protein